jgi:hypothetical protein
MRYSRIREGEIWDDPAGRHRVGCLDAAQTADVSRLMLGEKAALAIQDPPYNQVAFEERNVAHFIDWCRHWIAVTDEHLLKMHLYMSGWERIRSRTSSLCRISCS